MCLALTIGEGVGQAFEVVAFAVLQDTVVWWLGDQDGDDNSDDNDGDQSNGTAKN